MRLVKNTDVVVGDLLLLDTGDKLIADGVLVETHGLVVDEASLTGESDPIKKTLDEDPWCRSGTQVSEGSGRMMVVAVGERSEWGKTMALVGTAGSDDTPLQEKLADLAAAIGKVGFTVAVACFIALLVKWCVENRGFPLEQINNNGPVQFFLYAVTVVVVAIPEGLPLAVTIALAFSMKKMMRDNNFVRVLAACETMGGATAICSDKTGTLTENRMTVTEGWFAGKKYDRAPELGELPTAGGFARELAANCALNSKAFLIEHGPDLPLEFVGNRTECALLALALRKWGVDYKPLRNEAEERGDIVKLYGFSSAKKMASVLVRQRDATAGKPTGMLRLYNKGAAEWVLRRCNRVVNPEGAVVPLSEAERERLISEVVVGMASRGLRCICLTYTDYPENDPKRAADFFEDADRVDRDLVAMAIVGIKDPVRAEVPDAVRTCQNAGIVVRMVTGDNIHTARHIARECGILTDSVPGGGAGLALEGPTFRDMSDEELVPLLPRLQVLARSSPEDKLVLVRALKTHYGEVVAVTGDGTNDAPALKESDVGLAMGIAGTEVAKEGEFGFGCGDWGGGRRP
jgi:Ca2+-transporting ATPase